MRTQHTTLIHRMITHDLLKLPMDAHKAVLECRDELLRQEEEINTLKLLIEDMRSARAEVLDF